MGEESKQGKSSLRRVNAPDMGCFSKSVVLNGGFPWVSVPPRVQGGPNPI